MIEVETHTEREKEKQLTCVIEKGSGWDREKCGKADMIDTIHMIMST